jgi:hypothetical protein
MQRFDKGWIVGFLEGEGSFICRPIRPGYTTARECDIQATGTDRDTMEKLHKLAGGNLCGPYIWSKKPGAKPLFRWTLSKRKEVQKLLTLIKLHMSARRQGKIQIMLDYIKSRPIGKWERKAG